MPYATSSGALDYVEPKVNSKLFVAAWQGDVGDVRKYLALGANVNYQHHSGHTAAHQAGKFQRWEILITLIENGCDLTMKDGDNYTPLDLLTDTELEDLLKIDVKPECADHWSKAHELIAQKLDENKKMEAEYVRLEEERLAALNGTWTDETEEAEESVFDEEDWGEVTPGNTRPMYGYYYPNTTQNATAGRQNCNDAQPWHAGLLLAARAARA